MYLCYIWLSVLLAHAAVKYVSVAAVKHVAVAAAC